MTIPTEWLYVILILIASGGLCLGVFSLAFPERSIGLYQWIMRRLNWRVEPIHVERELRNTRVLGVLAALLSFLIFMALLQPRWFLLGRLQSGGLAW